MRRVQCLPADDFQTNALSRIDRRCFEELDHERGGFLKSAFVAEGGAATLAASGTIATPASAQTKPGQPTYRYLPANSDAVHWAISASC